MSSVMCYFVANEKIKPSPPFTTSSNLQLEIAKHYI